MFINFAADISVINITVLVLLDIDWRLMLIWYSVCN